MPSCVAGLVSGVVTLVVLLGVPSLVGLAVLVFCLCCNRIFGHFGKIISKHDLQAGDARLAVMREIIDSILQLKFMCWEESYLDLISAKRKTECKWLLRYRILLVTSITIGRVAPILAACATFTYMGLAGYEMKVLALYCTALEYTDSSLILLNFLCSPAFSLPCSRCFSLNSPLFVSLLLQRQT